jgi:hypothetical protein
MAERSTNAQFLKPAVLSLSFGVLFALFVSLLLVPGALYGGAGRRACCLSCEAEVLARWSQQRSAYHRIGAKTWRQKNGATRPLLSFRFQLFTDICSVNLSMDQESGR